MIDPVCYYCHIHKAFHPQDKRFPCYLYRGMTEREIELLGVDAEEIRRECQLFEGFVENGAGI